MKRFTWSIIVVFVLICGWYALWHQALMQLEVALKHNINKIEQTNENVRTSYTLISYGFPFKAGYLVKDVRITVKDPVAQTEAQADFYGENYVYISLFDIPKILIQKSIPFSTELENFKGVIKVQSPTDSAAVSVFAVRSIGAGVFSNNMTYKGVTSDVDFYVQSKELPSQRLLTINNIMLETSKNETDALLNISENIKFTGATFFDLKGENSLTVDTLDMSFNVKDFPHSKNFSDAFKKLAQERGEQVDLVHFKQALKNQITLMAQNESLISLEKYDITIGDFKGSLNGKLAIDKNYKPTGQAQVVLENISALEVAGLDKITPVFSLLKTESDTVRVNLKTEGNSLLLNGIPIIFTMPSLLNVVDRMPSVIYKNPSAKAEVEEVGGVEMSSPTENDAEVLPAMPPVVEMESVSVSEVTNTTVALPTQEDLDVKPDLVVLEPVTIDAPETSKTEQAPVEVPIAVSTSVIMSPIPVEDISVTVY
tara:strand:- start:36670 stop:38118 length:1449 start_codon:yes stop_codon:yes gene_type:complete